MTVTDAVTAVSRPGGLEAHGQPPAGSRMPAHWKSRGRYIRAADALSRTVDR
ncbi:MAG: hypothetical protein WD770_04355 [Actinomycetota bacterium]